MGDTSADRELTFGFCCVGGDPGQMPGLPVVVIKNFSYAGFKPINGIE